MSIPQSPSPLSNIIAAKTYNAAWFSGSTKEAQITTAIAAAVLDGALYVYIPANMLPYTAANVIFNNTIRMIREGGDFFNYDVHAYGAAGNGILDDTIAIQAALIAGAGKEVSFSSGMSYLTSSTLNISSNTIINGQGAEIKTITLSLHLLSCISITNVIIRNLKLTGVLGSTVLNNSGIVFSTSDHCRVEYCEISGMSGYGIYVTAASHHIAIENNYIHSLTGNYQNSCDIGLYQDAHFCTVRGNICDGGASIEVGILMQLNSTDHLIVGNRITAHTTYGIIDYDTTPRITNNRIIDNTITTIDGSTLGGTSGAGIYCVATGGDIIRGNHIQNTNVNTTTETLTPGAIGINNPFASILIEGNYIYNPQWYGIIVVSSVTISVRIKGNVIIEPNRTGIYVKSSSFVTVEGNTVVQLTTTPLTRNAIAVNTAGGGPFTNVSVKTNTVRGGTISIEVGNTNSAQVTDNNVSETATTAIKVHTAIGAVISGNNADASANATGNAILITNLTYSTVTTNLCASQATNCILSTGTCTGSMIDKSNILVAKTVVNIANQAVGCIAEAYGSAAKGSNNSQIGDSVEQNIPVVGNPKRWRCTVAGNPGTYVSEGNL